MKRDEGGKWKWVWKINESMLNTTKVGFMAQSSVDWETVLRKDSWKLFSDDQVQVEKVFDSIRLLDD